MIQVRNGWLVPVLGAVALIASAAPSSAQVVDEEGVGRLSIGGGIGFLLPSMTDVNSNISVANVFLGREQIRGMDKVHQGLLTGADIRYKFGQTPLPPDAEEETTGFMDRISVGFTWGAINTRSGFDVTRATTRFFSRATTYCPYVLYHVPWFEERLPRTSFYFGGGPLILTKVAVEWSIGDSTSNNFLDEGDLSEISGKAAATGSGTGLVLQTGGTFMLNSRFSVGVDAGYRLAKISNLELQNAVGQVKRFVGDDDPENPDTVIRRPGDWSVIDFFKRSRSAQYEGRDRTDSTDEGGCADCPLYYSGGTTEVDFSGLFANLSFRVHF